MLLPLESDSVAQMLRITAPAGSRLKQTDPIGLESIDGKPLALCLIKLGETEPQVSLGNMSPALGKAPGGQTNGVADPELQPPRQPGTQVHGTDRQPGRPVAWMSEGVGPVTLGHSSFLSRKQCCLGSLQIAPGYAR